MAMPVDIRGVLGSLGSSETASGHIALDDVELGECEFAFPLPGTYRVDITNTGAGLVASGEISATAHTECVRCLCEYDAEVCGDVQGFYVYPGREEGVPEEQDFEHIREEKIDLEPALLQALVLALPFSPVHSPDCRGLCPTCGADLNVTECGCAAEVPESPFSTLKDLLGPEGDVGDET